MIAGAFGGELRDALEHVLRRVRREVGDQLVVDGQVRRQHEEVVDAVRQVQVADEGAHQPRLAHAGGQREAQRRKLALEVRDRGELAADGLQRGRRIGAFAGRGDLRDAVENLQRPALRRAQAQAAGDGVDVAVHPLLQLLISAVDQTDDHLDDGFLLFRTAFGDQQRQCHRPCRRFMNAPTSRQRGRSPVCSRNAMKKRCQSLLPSLKA